MLKLNHFKHPLRTLGHAKEVLAARVSMEALAARAETRYQNDPRYNLQNVKDGFASRELGGRDTAILERICSAYIRAIDQEPSAGRTYQPTRWWKEVRQDKLAAVRQALASRDISALQKMYANFFRDPCSTGLVGVPYQMGAAYAGHAVDERFARFFLSNALHRLDHWLALTEHRFALRSLAGPNIGNPFGITLEGVLVRSGTEPHHYSAQRVAEFLPAKTPTVLEIGGGFGSMAYYLLRDYPGVRYANCDVPESLALASYYLLKAFPKLKFLLYGEEPVSGESLARFDVVLLPAFELRQLAAKSADLAFSSHALSSLSPAAAAEYLGEVQRITRRFFLFTARKAESKGLRELIRSRFPQFVLAEKRLLEWNAQKILNERDEECLYEIRATS